MRLLLAILLAAILSAQGSAAQPAGDDALAPISEQPGLPRVLLIGDSISIGYTLPVRRLLAGKANVHRIPGNGGPTTTGLAEIERWLGAGEWDLIHFNWGLHDLKRDTGDLQVKPEAYRSNLRALVKRLKSTGATLIWASTTPVPLARVSPPRLPSDVLLYNSIARQVMREHDVIVNDLYSAVAPRIGELQRPANVHFHPAGSQFLAERVASLIESSLPVRRLATNP